MSTNDDELSADQEALVANFRTDLEGTLGGVSAPDEDGAYWLKLGESSWQITEEQAEALREAAYDIALTKLYAEAPDEPKKMPFVARLMGSALGVGVFVLIAAATGRLAVKLLGF